MMGGKGHWNTAAGEHIQHTTRFRFHPFFPQTGRERGFDVCSTTYDLWSHARAADVFRTYPQEAEVLDISVMGRRLHCATKISGADRDQAIERDHAFFLKALVQLAEGEELRNRYVVDVKAPTSHEVL